MRFLSPRSSANRRPCDHRHSLRRDEGGPHKRRAQISKHLQFHAGQRSYSPIASQDYSNGFQIRLVVAQRAQFMSDDRLPGWLQTGGQIVHAGVFAGGAGQCDDDAGAGDTYARLRDPGKGSWRRHDRPYAGGRIGFTTRARRIGWTRTGDQPRRCRPVVACERGAGFSCTACGISNSLTDGRTSSAVRPAGVRAQVPRGVATRRQPVRAWLTSFHFGFSVGNVATYANAGIEVRAPDGVCRTVSASPILTR